ncbi:NAAT family transporter [Archaeoglobus sp.]
MDYISYFVTAFTTIFVIVDPPGNIPFFIALTERFSEKERDRVSKKSTLIACALLIIIALSGDVLLKFFHISIESLKVAGGILLFVIAIDILLGGARKEFYAKRGLKHIDVDSLAVFPIALPLYTGPGAITATIVLSAEASDIPSKILLIVSIVLVYLIVRLTHVYSEVVIRVLGKSGSDIVARVMAVFLAAIGVEYVFSGLESEIAKIVEAVRT